MLLLFCKKNEIIEFPTLKVVYFQDVHYFKCQLSDNDTVYILWGQETFDIAS